MAYWLYELIRKLPVLLCLPVVTDEGFNLSRANEIFQCMAEAKWHPGGYTAPYSKEAGYKKLAAFLGITVQQIVNLEKPQFPADRSYDLDERAALLDMIEKRNTKRPVSKIQDAVSLADEEAMPDVWELQVGLECSIRGFPIPISKRCFPWKNTSR